MFGGTIFKGPRPIGLEVDDGVVRMLQLAGTPGRLRLLAARRRSLPTGLDAGSAGHPDALRTAIRSMLDEGVFLGRRVVSCLPASVVQYKNLRLPPMPASELAEAVRWEAAERLQDTGGKLAIQHFDAGEIRQGDEARHEVIAVAASDPHVEKHVETLVACGLRPDCIDVSASASARLVASLRGTAEDAGEVHVLLNIRRDLTEVLITRGRRVMFCKTIGLGAATIDAAVARRMGVSDDEAARLRSNLDDADASASNGDAAAVVGAAEPALEDLGREIGLCLRYYGVTFRGRRPEQAVLLGALSGQRWLTDRLTSKAGVRVQTWSLAEQIELADAAVLGDAGSGAWAVALGLALRRTTAAVLLPGRQPREVAA